MPGTGWDQRPVCILSLRKLSLFQSCYIVIKKINKNSIKKRGEISDSK